jgi:hypothetical protein
MYKNEKFSWNSSPIELLLSTDQLWKKKRKTKKICLKYAGSNQRNKITPMTCHTAPKPVKWKSRGKGKEVKRIAITLQREDLMSIISHRYIFFL